MAFVISIPTPIAMPSFTNGQQSCQLQHSTQIVAKYNFSSFKRVIIKFWELNVFATEAVVRRCSSKWPKRPSTLLKETPTQRFSCEICKTCKKTFLTKHLWWLLLSPKQTKRNKKILIYEYFCWSIMAERNRSNCNCNIWWKCSLIMKYYNSQVTKKPSWKNLV